MPLVGKYYAHVGSGERELVIPVIVSNNPEDLYNACSPLHSFHSSLTFEPGKPMEHDAHGAEETIKGYIRLGTHVAYIPEHLVYEGKFSKPPWAARVFIHRGRNENNIVSPIPQPAYSMDRVIGQILTDAVDYILFFTTNVTTYGSCTSVYDGVYVDIAIRRPILREKLNEIDKYWGTNQFVKRVKD